MFFSFDVKTTGSSLDSLLKNADLETKSLAEKVSHIPDQIAIVVQDLLKESIRQGQMIEDELVTLFKSKCRL